MRRSRVSLPADGPLTTNLGTRETCAEACLFEPHVVTPDPVHTLVHRNQKSSFEQVRPMARAHARGIELGARQQAVLNASLRKCFGRERRTHERPPHQVQPSGKAGSRQRTGRESRVRPRHRPRHRRREPTVATPIPSTQIQQITRTRQHPRNNANRSTAGAEPAPSPVDPSTTDHPHSTAPANNANRSTGAPSHAITVDPSTTDHPHSTAPAKQRQQIDWDRRARPCAASSATGACGRWRVRRGCWIGGRRRWGR